MSTDPSLNKLLSQSIEAEAHVLGAILLDGRAYYAVTGIVTGEVITPHPWEAETPSRREEPTR